MRFDLNFGWVNFKLISMIFSSSTCCECALRLVSLDVTFSTGSGDCLYHQATSHYLSQCCSRSCCHMALLDHYELTQSVCTCVYMNERWELFSHKKIISNNLSVSHWNLTNIGMVQLFIYCLGALWQLQKPSLHVQSRVGIGHRLNRLWHIW